MGIPCAPCVGPAGGRCKTWGKGPVAGVRSETPLRLDDAKHCGLSLGKKPLENSERGVAWNDFFLSKDHCSFENTFLCCSSENTFYGNMGRNMETSA